MQNALRTMLKKELKAIEQAGLYKHERVLSTKQGRQVKAGGRRLLNFCSNNYLGLAGSQELAKAAKKGLEKYGFGLSSVRFICGTQDIHKALEKETAKWLRKEDAILYSSCMAANTGFFASFLTEEDVILTDALNHASIIDGIRLCKAERYIFKHMDMEDLEKGLKEGSKKRLRCIVTDGVFSMDGDIAPLKEITKLAKKYNAFVVVDDSHASGFMGKKGTGTPEHCSVAKEVDVVISTYGKALGGASGGFVAGKKELIDFLRQRSRTYLFSNSLPPVVAYTSLHAIRYVKKHPKLQKTLWDNVGYFRELMQKAGFVVPKSVHPIVPIMIGDAKKTAHMASAMLKDGIYVVGFSYPVVPQNEARIRVQLSSAHTKQDIEKVVEAFIKHRGS